MKGLMFYIVLSVSLGFSSGYFFAGTSINTIQFRKNVHTQEVRDSYFRRCEVQGATLRKDGITEEVWSCPQTKLFLLKKHTAISMEPQIATVN